MRRLELLGSCVWLYISDARYAVDEWRRVLQYMCHENVLQIEMRKLNVRILHIFELVNVAFNKMKTNIIFFSFFKCAIT